MPDNDSLPVANDPTAKPPTGDAIHPTEEWKDTKKAELRDTVPDELRQHPRYRLLGTLGRGGMGTVYKAEHKLLERAVVLKVIRPELVANANVVQRFQREARLAARLQHPNVVAVYEAEEFGSTQMLVMEFIEGVNLAELLSERGLLPVAEACELVRQAAIGLDYVSEQGLVHRDIKPQNLLVSRSGQVKILDLGMATLKDGANADGDNLTSDKQFVGTVDFAAPEQWESSRDVDIRADIYSLGCTLYYLLAGESPFPHKKYTSMMQQMWAHSQAPLPPIRELRPDLPEGIATVLAKMLAKSRNDRYTRPAEVAAALAPYTEGCNLQEYVRSARRTTTSTLDFSRISSVQDAAGPARRRPPRRALLIGGSVLGAGLLAVVLVAAFGVRAAATRPLRRPRLRRTRRTAASPRRPPARRSRSAYSTPAPAPWPAANAASSTPPCSPSTK